MTDATTREAGAHEAPVLDRIDAALARAEDAAARLRSGRDQAEARAAALDTAGTRAVAALDALLAGVR